MRNITIKAEGKTEMTSDSSDEDTCNPLNYPNYNFISYNIIRHTCTV